MSRLGCDLIRKLPNGAVGADGEHLGALGPPQHVVVLALHAIPAEHLLGSDPVAVALEVGAGRLAGIADDVSGQRLVRIGPHRRQRHRNARVILLVLLDFEGDLVADVAGQSDHSSGPGRVDRIADLGLVDAEKNRQSLHQLLFLFDADLGPIQQQRL